MPNADTISDEFFRWLIGGLVAVIAGLLGLLYRRVSAELATRATRDEVEAMEKRLVQGQAHLQIDMNELREESKNELKRVNDRLDIQAATSERRHEDTLSVIRQESNETRRRIDDILFRKAIPRL